MAERVTVDHDVEGSKPFSHPGNIWLLRFGVKRMKSLLDFNAFGLVKITRYDISCTLTSITVDGKAITRVLSVELDNPSKDFGEKDFVTATFAAYIEEGEKSRLVFNDLVSLPWTPQIGDIPGVTKVIGRAIKLIREALSNGVNS